MRWFQAAIKMNLCVKILLQAILLGNIIDCFSQTPNEIKNYFSGKEINYIYNRACDLALRDNTEGDEIHPLFYNAHISLYDTIVITVEPSLSRRAFGAVLVDELDSIKFDDSLNLQEAFKNVSITNFDIVSKKSCGEKPILSGNHIMHIIFSDIYIHNTYYYVGVLVHHKLENGSATYPVFTILKFEYCQDKYILFRKIFKPLGVADGKNIYYSAPINDKKCFHY